MTALSTEFATPVRAVLEGVPRVGFFDRPGGEWEHTPFPSTMKACLEYLGEHNSYSYLMGMSGAAFRLLWKHGWHPDNIDIYLMAEDVREPYRRTFEAAGYAHELMLTAEGHTEEEFRARIVDSIAIHERPLIGFGGVGPPECSVITGYDEAGKVLIGWSFFQDTPEPQDQVTYEPSGYFRNRNWFWMFGGLIQIGAQMAKPAQAELDRKALEWALTITRTSMVRGRYSGLAAYTAWVNDLLRDDDFPAGDLAVLQNRMMSHNDNMTVVWDGRTSAAQFLREMAERDPAMKEHLLAAASCYQAAADWITEGIMLVGIGREEPQVRKLAEPEVRRQLSTLILQARDADARAAEHIDQALAQ